MSRIKTVLTSSAILLGSSAALLTGGIAKAEPAPLPVPTPNVPGINIIQGLMDPAKSGASAEGKIYQMSSSHHRHEYPG